VRFDPWRSATIQLAATVETSGCTSFQGIQRVDWTAREQEGKLELLGAGQSLRVGCSQEGAYEALEEQRRDGVARDGIGSTFAPRTANGPRHIIPLRSPLEKAAISTVFMFTRPPRNSIPRWLPST